MRRSIRNDAAERIRISRRSRHWHMLVTCLAAVVVFITTYMLILPAITMERASACGMEEHIHGDECYEQEQVLACGLEDDPEHTHTEACYETEELLICTLEEHTHTEACYEEEAEDSDEESGEEAPNAGEGAEPGPETENTETPAEDVSGNEEEPETEQTSQYSYEDDNLSVTAELPADSSVPEDAVLRVTAITEEDDSYEELTRQAEEALSGQPEQIVLYDVSFYRQGEEGEEYLPVSDQATVSFRFKETVLEESSGEISVLHYEQEQETPVALETVEIQKDENDALTDLTFRTEGFSVFAVVKVGATYEEATDIDVENLTGEYYIVRKDGSNLYPMMSNPDRVFSGLFDGMDIGYTVAVSDLSGLQNCTAWRFEKAGPEANQYYICVESGGTTKYLQGSSFDKEAAALALVNSEDDATVFTVGTKTGGIYLAFEAGGFTYYINSFGGISNATSFAGYIGNDEGSTLNFYRKSTGTTVNDLAGRSFAIVSRAADKALTQETKTVNSVSGLASADVSVIDGGSDGVSYVVGDIPKWTFDATDTPGVYYISTVDSDENKKYLRMLETNYTSPADGGGSLTLSKDKQEITVSLAGDGNVYLSATVNDKTGYVNMDAGTSDFWTYSETGNNSTLRLFEETMFSGSIFYDLNLPSLSTSLGAKSWKTIPSLDGIFQGIDTGGTLFDQPKGYYKELGISGQVYGEQHPEVAKEDNPYYKMYRMNAGQPGNLASGAPTLGYEEYIFYGWTYTDTSGVEHLFKANAAFKAAGDAGITLKDTEGRTVTIPPGATLQGKWDQVAAPVYFFVNYTGTILDTEGDVKPRHSSNYLDGVAIGWIFFGKEVAGANGTYALDVHEEINAMFTNREDLDLELKLDHRPQILIISATNIGSSGNPQHDLTYGGSNAKIISDSAMKWVLTKSDTYHIKLSTGNGETTIQLTEETLGNYSIRWYVAKEQNDSWHIDGVLTAVTKPLVVTKSFAGLEETQIQTLLENYSIDLWIRGNENTSTYMTLDTAEHSQPDGKTAVGILGQYSYDGYNPATQTAKWTVRLLAGEHVTLTEKEYSLSGYIPSSYSVIDGNGGSIYQGDSAGYNISQTENNDIYDVVGGRNGSVAFSNTYTKKGKGSLSILKKNASTGTILQNVKFQLVEADDGTTVCEDITDASGRADFMNLNPGTYRLKEAAPLDGFRSLANTITVEVSNPDSGSGLVTVTVTETDAVGDPVYQAPGETSILYTIENQMDANTLIVEKTFKEITPEEVAALGKSDPGYQIVLTDENDNTIGTLKLSTASYQSTDGMRYQWIVTDVGTQQLTVTESGYACAAYIDTSVTAKLTVGDEEKELIPAIEDSLAIGTAEDKASVSITTDGAKLNVVSFTNTYTNEFVLYLQKKDSVTGQPLRGAIFELYGSYEESTNTSRKIKYYKSEDEVGTLYYIGETGVSDENGLAVVEGLNLSNEGKTYAYVLSEIVAPDGYVKPNYENGIVPEDQVITVTVDKIANNVYTTNMRNQTAGAPLIVKKEVPESDLPVENVYSITITISAKEASIREGNRVYEYVIYNKDGTEDQGTRTAGGTQASGELNVDTCTFDVALKDGQYVVVKDVPVGYTYQVKENITSDEYYCAIVNENGSGSYDNYNSTATGTILEVPDEIKDIADEGYAENQEARLRNTVTVSNYSLANKEEAKTEITVKKEWLPAGQAGDQAVMGLYQVQNGGLTTAVLYDSEGEQTLNAGNSWTYTWSDLPLYDETGTVKYDYYLAEVPVDGYAQSYSIPLEELRVSGKSVWAAHVTSATITVTNSTGYELPMTGGAGTAPFTAGGALLAAGSLLYGYRRKRRRERRFQT